MLYVLLISVLLTFLIQKYYIFSRIKIFSPTKIGVLVKGSSIFSFLDNLMSEKLDINFIFSIFA